MSMQEMLVNVVEQMGKGCNDISRNYAPWP